MDVLWTHVDVPFSSSTAIHQSDPKSLLLFLSRRKRVTARGIDGVAMVAVLGGKVHMHFQKGAGLWSGVKGRICQVLSWMWALPSNMSTVIIRYYDTALLMNGLQ